MSWPNTQQPLLIFIAMRRYKFSTVLALLSILFLNTAFAIEEKRLSLRPTNETPSWGLIYQKDIEFRPVNNEIYQFKFAMQAPGSVSLELLSADNDVIATPLNNKRFSAGTHTAKWDGRDEQGNLVPDEVYTPRLIITTSNTRYIDEPHQYSGGEILKNLQWETEEKTISFTLPQPSRVLIRTGINDGPVMRVLKHWQAAASGRSTIRWDGYDKNQVEYFADHPKRWSVVMAYEIPQYAVITDGNDSISYRDYRSKRDWQAPDIDLSGIELQRNGVRLSKDYFLPRQFQPDVQISVDSQHKANQFNLPVASDSLRLHIDVPTEDRWILDSSFYETSLYLDYQFMSEEEQGFVPMVWDVDITRLSAGRHFATVQLFGFGGFITSATVAFWVE